MNLFFAVLFAMTLFSQEEQNTPAPSRLGDDPVVIIDLEDSRRDIHIGEPFTVVIKVTSKPEVHVNLPSKIDPGVRFQLEGEPSESQTLTFDSGNVLRVYRLTLVSWTTDRLLDRRLERVRSRLIRHEQDLNAEKTKLTEARLAGQDTKTIEERIRLYQGRVDESSRELNAMEEQRDLKPIPVTYRRPDGTLGVIQSHEPGKGPRIIISSKLANEPDPKLKEPQSDENVKAGGPFWEPFSLHEENTALKNVLIGLLIGLLIMALLLPLVLWLRKKWKREPPPAPPRPAHVIAFERLETLRSRGIPAETEDAQAFAFELSEILREYFGNRYHFYSLEMTTTELLEELERIRPSGITSVDYREFFDFLDMVKFARAPFSAEEASSTLETGVDFVRKTLLVQLEPMATAQDARTPGASQEKPLATGEGEHPDADGLPESMDDLHRRLLTKKPEDSSGGNHETT